MPRRRVTSANKPDPRFIPAPNGGDSATTRFSIIIAILVRRDPRLVCEVDVAPVIRFDSVTKGYRGYVLALLTLVFVINFIDRQVLAVLIEPIKRELKLTDTQLGLLSGRRLRCFVLLPVPLARLADLKSRRNLIAVCMIVWSSMTALCGGAVNFAQLLMARIGVAIGEAGCVAPSHSILSDYFRPRRSTNSVVDLFGRRLVRRVPGVARRLAGRHVRLALGDDSRRAAAVWSHWLCCSHCASRCAACRCPRLSQFPILRRRGSGQISASCFVDAAVWCSSPARWGFNRW